MKNKAKEFRLGNLVMYDGRVFEIDTIAEEFPTLNTSEFGIGVVDWNTIEPIELTDEWLFEFGFEYQSRFDNFNLGNFEVYNSPVYIGFLLDSIWEANAYVEIHFVHQLQNLYFALTGEELKLKAK